MNTELATQRLVSDLIEEYRTKSDNAESAAEAFHEAVRNIEMAAAVGGVYVGSILRHGGSSVHASDMQKNLLKSGWKAVYNLLKIQQIASAKDRKRFDVALEQPAPLTMDNVRATFGDYLLNSRQHILRGLAECFVDLDPAYKSHAKVRIGVKGLPKRVILSNFGSYGSWGRERLHDICNTLRVYRGEAHLSGQEFADMLDFIRGGEKQNPMPDLEFRAFNNGNLHVIFKKYALLDINRALAEYYGEVLPDAPEVNPTKKQSTAVSKDLQYYPTPQSVVDLIIGSTYSLRGSRVLEPSCGCGRFLDAIRKEGATVLGVEVDRSRAEQCRAKGHDVLNQNFLEMEPTGDFDFVIMNPPFYGRHYVKHINHALKFLKEDGVLVSVLPATAHYDHKEIEGTWRDLPVGSFSESGTNVPTGYITINKQLQSMRNAA